MKKSFGQKLIDAMRKPLGQTLVDAMRKAEGLEVHEVPFNHLSEGAMAEIEKIMTSRTLRGTAGLYGSVPLLLIPLTQQRWEKGMLLFTSATVIGSMVAIRNTRIKEKLANLRELYGNGTLILGKHRPEHSECLRTLDPTHFTASKDRLVFIRETKDNALAKFLSAQPAKTMRQPTRANQEWRTV